jgi:hypothetical protein
MAENESLDLGGPYAQRWNPVANGFKNGDSVDQLCRLVETALRGGLRKVLKQLAEKGVSFAELMRCRHSPTLLKQLLRRLDGHQYARLFESAATASGPTGVDCTRRWIDSILETVMDQIGYQMGGTENWPSAYEVQERINGVRHHIEPEVERIAANLANDHGWLPRQSPDKSQSPSDSTAEVLSMSLLGSTRS